MNFTQNQNTELARKLGLLGANEVAGGGLVNQRLAQAAKSNPNILQQYEQARGAASGSQFKANTVRAGLGLPTGISMQQSGGLAEALGIKKTPFQTLYDTSRPTSDVMRDTVLPGNKNLTSDRAAQLDGAISEYDAYLKDAARKYLLDTNPIMAANYGNRISPEVAWGANLANAPQEIRDASKQRELAMIERYGQKDNTMGVLKGMAATLLPFAGGTLLGGANIAGGSGATTLTGGSGSLGNAFSSGISQLTSGVGDALGGGLSTVGKLASSIGSTLKGALTGGAAGSGVEGSNIFSGIGSLLAPAATIYGVMNQQDAIDDIQKNLVEGQQGVRQVYDDLNTTLQDNTARQEEILSPYVNNSAAINNVLAQELLSGNLGKPFTAADFEADPGYQFRKSEGEKAIDRKLAAMGMLNSGAAVKEAAEYNQGLADQTYNDAFNRYITGQTTRYNMLSGQGNSSAAQALVNAIRGLGNQQAYIANPVAGTYSNIGNILGSASAAEQNMYAQLIAKLFGGNA